MYVCMYYTYMHAYIYICSSYPQVTYKGHVIDIDYRLLRYYVYVFYLLHYLLFYGLAIYCIDWLVDDPCDVCIRKCYHGFLRKSLVLNDSIFCIQRFLFVPRRNEYLICPNLDWTKFECKVRFYSYFLQCASFVSYTS